MAAELRDVFNVRIFVVVFLEYDRGGIVVLV